MPAADAEVTPVTLEWIGTHLAERTLGDVAIDALIITTYATALGLAMTHPEYAAAIYREFLDVVPGFAAQVHIHAETMLTMFPIKEAR